LAQETELKIISDARLAAIASEVANFTSGMNLVVAGLNARMLDLLTSGDITVNAPKIAELIYIQKELTKQLNRLGYSDKVGQFISKFDDQQQYALAVVKELKPASERLAPLNTRALATLKETDYRFLAAIGPAAVQAVATGVIQNTIQGRPRAEIIEKVRNKLSLELANRAVTYADTALTSYDRRVSMEIWQEAGLDKFLYRGPKDIKNRTFCEARVGKVFTLAEIQQMVNGTGPEPPLIYGGGWNCRHVFTPIPGQAVAGPAQPAPPEKSSISKPMGKATEIGGPTLSAAAGQAALDALIKTPSRLFTHQPPGLIDPLIPIIGKDFQKFIEAVPIGAAVRTRVAIADLHATTTGVESKGVAKYIDKVAAGFHGLPIVAQFKGKLYLLGEMIDEATANVADAMRGFGLAMKHLAGDTGGSVKIDLATLGLSKLGKQDGAQLVHAESLLGATHIDVELVKLKEKVAQAANPNQLFEEHKDPATGEITYTVLGGSGTVYKTKLGKAYHEAKKAFATLAPEKTAAILAAKQVKDQAKAALAALLPPLPPPTAPPTPTAPPLPPQKAAQEDPGDALAASLYKPYVPSHLEANFPHVPTGPLPAPGEFPPAAQLALKQNQNRLPGAFEKDIYTDTEGNEYLFKPVRKGDTVGDLLSHVDVSVAKLQLIVRPDANSPATYITLDGRSGSLQRMVPDLSPDQNFEVSHLSPVEISQIQREQVVDWLTSQHDSHDRNWLRTVDGRIVGIDKTQAYKFLGKDKLTVDYSPNNSQPLYNGILKAAKAGTLSIDPAAVMPAIRHVEKITDDELRTILQPIADARPDGKAFLEKAVARKNSLRADFEKLYSDVIGKPVSLAEPTKPAIIGNKRQQTAIGQFAFLGDRNVEAVEQVAAAKWQGMSVSIDAGDIENQNVLVTQEKRKTGGERTVLRFKVRPEAEARLLAALGTAEPTAAKAYNLPAPDDVPLYLGYPLGYQLKPGGEHAPPLPKSGEVASVSQFKKILAGTLVPSQLPDKDGHGNPITHEMKVALVEAVGAYKEKLIAAQQVFNEKQHDAWMAANKAAKPIVAEPTAAVPITLTPGGPGAPPLPAGQLGKQVKESAQMVAAMMADEGMQLEMDAETIAGHFGVSTKESKQIFKAIQEYSLALGKAQAKLDSVAAAAAVPDKPTMGFSAKRTGAILTDQKSVGPGGDIIVAAENTPLQSSVTWMNADHPAKVEQVAIRWKDGAQARYIPYLPVKPTDDRSSLFALQGTMEIIVDGAATPAAVDGALAKLASLGVSATAATAESEELLYLHKAAYSAKVHNSAAWEAATRAPEPLQAMRDYWSHRLKVPDVTKLPAYEPEGQYPQRWDGAHAKAGTRTHYRFDFSEADVAKTLAGYKIYQDPSYGGDTIENLLTRALPNNASLLSTTERIRVGIQNKDDPGGTKGSSTASDLNSGGAAYVFTRLRKTVEPTGLYWKPEQLLRRMDIRHYSHDQYGATLGTLVENLRAPDVQTMLAYASGSSGNEINFQGSLHLLRGLDRIKTSGAGQRKRVLDILTKNGISYIGGRAIEDVVT